MLDLGQVLGRSPVLPVLTIEREVDAVPLARALARGGLRTLEVTLRTPAALGAIRLIGREVEEVVVGAGTVLSAADLEAVVEAGAAFAVSPGLTEQIIRTNAPIPVLPGVATASEAMSASDHGFKVLKLFPAVPIGGAAVLRALAGPLPHLQFCPTGGVDPVNAREFLQLANVICVGGGWVAPPPLIAEGRWTEITRLAEEANALSRSGRPGAGLR